jgi:hypothetical protein
MVLSILMGYCAMARRSECACKSARLEKSEPALLGGLVSVPKLRRQHRARRCAIPCVCAVSPIIKTRSWVWVTRYPMEWRGHSRLGKMSIEKDATASSVKVSLFAGSK